MAAALIERRSRHLLLMAGFFLVLLLANLFRMQILKGLTYRLLSEKNRLRTVYLEAPRGKILDRNGLALAVNRLSFNCTLTPSIAKSRITQSLSIVATVLDESPAELLKRYQLKKPGIFNTVVLAEDIGLSKAMAIEERLDELPGFMVETKPQRVYPRGQSTAHLLGYLGPQASDEQFQTRIFDYRLSDWIGREGIEKQYEGYLRGRSGGIQMEVNSRGRMIRALGVREPVEGKDLRLTVDARLQAYVQELLEGQKGAVMAVDLTDGAVLSLNSSPTFDPNQFSTRNGRRFVGRYLRDDKAPMLNRGIQGCYPPGSIFKMVTALAALEAGKIRPGTRFICTGGMRVGERRFPCWNARGHGPQALAEAFAHSCNVFFYSTGLAAGADALHEMSLRLGLGRKTGIDLPGERAGFVPSRAWKRDNLKMPWYDGETANFAIGQGSLLVSPIQALEMVSSVALGGRKIRPHAVDSIDGVRVSEAEMGGLALAPDGLNATKEGLDQVVNSDSGTGRLARVAGLRIAGKTGTAQSGQYKTHAWFVGYAPAGKPKIALVVFLEHGGRGGVSAATLAHSVFGWLKDARYL